MLSIIEINVAERMDSLMPLFRLNWAETGFDFDMLPNVALISQLQSIGIMFVMAAYLGDQIIGYSSAMVSPHIYSTEIVCCASDALFVLPEHRKTSAGARLILATEQAGKERGANRMLWHTRAGTQLAAVLEKRGYEPADTVVMKRI